MPKRHLDQDIDEDHRVKRLRTNKPDIFSSLSDELILRTLSYLTISELIVCERLSCRFKGLATDSQLWKSAFYDRFVRPRASRIPGLRDREVSAKSLHFSSKRSRWLEDDNLVKRGRATNWKRQYRLRHNWSRGCCRMRETQIAERPSVPPLLVRLTEGIVITTDSTTGLRAWQMKDEQQLLATVLLAPDDNSDGNSFLPTSLAIDSTNSTPNRVDVAVGFADGKFSIYQLFAKEKKFAHLYTHAPSSNGQISAIAYAVPYLLTMTEAQLLSLYRFNSSGNDKLGHAKLISPSLISSLKSHTAWPPLSLTIRTSSTSILASIAYAMPTFLAGWAVGLQEIRLTSRGSVLESRLACAANEGFAPLAPQQQPSPPDSRTPSPIRSGSSLAILAKPTTLSYTHPYLLAAHSDNTLTLYMVTSNTHQLSIGTGSRLWGHTSSVSGAYVGDRGKAVSVSTQGNELRVWELEGGVSSNSSRWRVAAGAASVQVRPEKMGIERDSPEDERNGFVAFGTRSGASQGLGAQDVATTKGWVAFDEEKVVVLHEKTQGAQTLVVYDFS